MRCIDSEALRESLINSYPVELLNQMTSQELFDKVLAAIDYAPAVSDNIGHWVIHETMQNDYCGDIHYTCSNCSCWAQYKTNYCPKCGTKMSESSKG